MAHLKIFVAGLEHETNSFSPIPTDMRSYERMILYRPETGGPIEAYDRVADFVQLAAERKYRVIRGISALAQPAGPTRREDYEALRAEILDDLRAACPLDAAFLVLHGAQMAHDYDDCEGDLIRRARDIVGPEVPIGVQLDLHGNLTRLMTDNATFIIACKEYPHTDYRERAAELIELCARYRAGAVKPVHSVFRVPMLGIFRTTESPLRELVDFTKEVEKRAEILTVSLLHGFPWSDMEESGSAVLVTTDNERELGDSLAAKIGTRFFAMRHLYRDGYLSIAEALDAAARNAAGPVVIADVADNPGGGAGGDSTYVLGEILRRGIGSVALAMLYDPGAVEIARAAGVGARIRMRIGGKISELSGSPLDVDATVLAVNDNARQKGLGPQLEHLGASAAIAVDGVDIVLNSRRQQTFSPDCFTEFGIDPRKKNLLVVKSSHHFYDQFQQLASRIIYCVVPGTVNPDLSRLPYRKIRRPIWPLEDISL